MMISPIIGTIVDGASRTLQTKAGALVAELFGDWLGDKIDTGLVALHAVLPEVTTLGVVACGLILMLPGSNKHRWFARMATVFVVGTVLLIM